MKITKNKKHIISLSILFVLVVAVIIVGLISIDKNSATNSETREINNFIAQADIDPINDWVVYSKCGDSGGENDGYLLQANDLAVSQAQASELKNLAANRGYNIKERDDGFVIVHNKWEVIVLNKNRADLFISIQYSQQPLEFPQGNRLCN